MRAGVPGGLGGKNGFVGCGRAKGPPARSARKICSNPCRALGEVRSQPQHGSRHLFGVGLLIPEEAAPQFLDDAAPRNGMMPPPDSEMISPPITE